MRKIKIWLLPLLTLLLVIGGAALPFAISQAQDAYAAKRTEIRLFDPISLTLQPELTVYDVLQMMHQDYICFTYDGPTKLSAADAQETAKACLRTLSQQVVPLLINTKAEITIELQLAVLNDNSDESAILWVCNFQNTPDGNYILIIDDASGKMVEFIALKPDMVVSGNRVVYFENLPLSESQIAISQAIDLEKWLVFCQTYYGIEIVDMYDYHANEYQQYNFQYRTANTDAVYDLILSISSNYLIFN